MFTSSLNQVVKLESRTWRGSSWFMLMKELGFSYAGWEPPFIHHMVKPRVYSRHFRNLTTIPKLIANHNSSTWLCFLGLYVLAVTHFVKSFSFLSFADPPETVWVNGKSAQVSEDGGFLEAGVLLRACYWQETCC